MSREISAADIKRGHLRARQRQLRELIKHMESAAGESATLDPGQVMMVLGLLRDIRDGVDVRETYDIQAKPGAAPTKIARNKLIAALFLKKGGGHNDVGLSRVIYFELGRATHLAESTLREIVRDYAKDGAKIARVQTLEQLELFLNLVLDFAVTSTTN